MAWLGKKQLEVNDWFSQFTPASWNSANATWTPVNIEPLAEAAHSYYPEKSNAEPSSFSDVNVPLVYRGPFQTWGKYRVGYKAILADGTSQYDKKYVYTPGMWHEGRDGLWLAANTQSVRSYWKGAGRLARVLFTPEAMTASQDKAKRIFVQALTPPLFMWPTDEILWPVFFDPDGGQPIDGPFIEWLVFPKNKALSPAAEEVIEALNKLAKQGYDKSKIRKISLTSAPPPTTNSHTLSKDGITYTVSGVSVERDPSWLAWILSGTVNGMNTTAIITDLDVYTTMGGTARATEAEKAAMLVDAYQATFGVKKLDSKES